MHPIAFIYLVVTYIMIGIAVLGWFYVDFYHSFSPIWKIPIVIFWPIAILIKILQWLVVDHVKEIREWYKKKGTKK